MKKFVTTVLVLLLCAVAVWAAITIDGTPDAFTEAAADTVHTSASLTVASNTNRLLVVPCSVNANNTLVSYDFNADTLTELIESDSTSMEMHLLYRIAPDIATDDVTITSPTSQRLIQCPISLYNVIQTSPFRHQLVESGTTETITADLTLTTVVGDWVGSCMAVVRSGGLDPGALTPDNGTELEELNNTVGTRFSCTWQIAVGATTTVGWSWPGPNANWAHVAFAVIPASTATPIYYQRRMRE